MAMMAAGTTRITRGTRAIVATTTVPTTMLCQCHAEGVVSACQKPISRGTPSTRGNWPPMMVRPTPLR